MQPSDTSDGQSWVAQRAWVKSEEKKNTKSAFWDGKLGFFRGAESIPIISFE